jgi:hypothetical protein
MSGAKMVEEIEHFGNIHIDWLKQYLNISKRVLFSSP